MRNKKKPNYSKQTMQQQQRNLFSKQQVSDSQRENFLGKTLPMSLEAEKSVLGAVLMDDSCFHILEEQLQSQDFYVPAHQIIFKHMLTLVRANQRVDMITLQDGLQKANELTMIGDIAYLIDLQENIPTFGMLEQHVQIIKAKAVLRNLISSSVDIISSCYSQNDTELDVVIDEAEKKIFQIIHNRTKQNFVQLNIWLKKTFQHLSSIKSSSRGITGVATHFKGLDRMTSGFQSGDLIILAARPSMGKTSFALNVAINAARSGLGVGVFSLEMAAEQLTLRLLSTESVFNQLPSSLSSANNAAQAYHDAAVLFQKINSYPDAITNFTKADAAYLGALSILDAQNDSTNGTITNINHALNTMNLAATYSLLAAQLATAENKSDAISNYQLAATTYIIAAQQYAQSNVISATSNNSASSIVSSTVNSVTSTLGSVASNIPSI